MARLSEIENDLFSKIPLFESRWRIEKLVSKIDKATLLALDLYSARKIVRFPKGKLRWLQVRVHEIVREHIRATQGIVPQDLAKYEESVADLYLQPVQDLMRSRLNTLQLIPHLQGWRSQLQN